MTDDERMKVVMGWKRKIDDVVADRGFGNGALAAEILGAVLGARQEERERCVNVINSQINPHRGLAGGRVNDVLRDVIHKISQPTSPVTGQEPKPSVHVQGDCDCGSCLRSQP